MTRTPTFEELFRDCQRTAVHLEMRDAYMKSDPAFIDWKAGQALDLPSGGPTGTASSPPPLPDGSKYAVRGSSRRRSASTSASSTT